MLYLKSENVRLCVEIFVGILSWDMMLVSSAYLQRMLPLRKPKVITNTVCGRLDAEDNTGRRLCQSMHVSPPPE